jgi:hypothetical protein
MAGQYPLAVRSGQLPSRRRGRPGRIRDGLFGTEGEPERYDVPPDSCDSVTMARGASE